MLVICSVVANSNSHIYLGLAKLFLKSLREEGKFEGEVHLYTDIKDPLKEHSKFATICRIEFPQELPSAYWSKAYIGASQDFRNYNKIAILDVDLEFVAPFEPYILAEGDFLQFESTSFSFCAKSLDMDHYGWALIKKELPNKLRDKCRKLCGLNTSLVVGDYDIFKKFCKEWWVSRFISPKGLEWTDQPIANWLVYGVRRYKGFTSFTPWVNFKGSISSKERVLSNKNIEC